LPARRRYDAGRGDLLPERDQGALKIARVGGERSQQAEQNEVEQQHRGIPRTRAEA